MRLVVSTSASALVLPPPAAPPLTVTTPKTINSDVIKNALSLAEDPLGEKLILQLARLKRAGKLGYAAVLSAGIEVLEDTVVVAPCAAAAIFSDRANP